MCVHRVEKRTNRKEIYKDILRTNAVKRQNFNVYTAVIEDVVANIYARIARLADLRIDIYCINNKPANK